ENTKSRIVNKTISMDVGINIYRGVIRIPNGARNATSNVECESLILDDKSYAYTYPHNQIEEPTASVSHEATTLRLTEDQIFYLLSRGLDEDDAKNLLIMGFLDELFIEVPFEVANILKKVLEIEFEKLGGVG
ncbi:MAG TPA: Fe-S cluster assembly protein SufB, partial [Thermoprotei archaeon]|nr:Fe-S cluster assembly protein SufB [Thermoprotei archaeon]